MLFKKKDLIVIRVPLYKDRTVGDLVSQTAKLKEKYPQFCYRLEIIDD